MIPPDDPDSGAPPSSGPVPVDDPVPGLALTSGAAPLQDPGPDAAASSGSQTGGHPVPGAAICLGVPPADFELTKYGYDREHELELNKFTHALEVEQLKLLVLLNGGAAAALLTFAKETTYPLTLAGLLGPVVLWILGLVAAAAAAVVLRQVQAEFSRAYRHRRQAIEWSRSQRPDVPNQANPIALPDRDLLETLSERYVKEQAAEEARGEAGKQAGEDARKAAQALSKARNERRGDLLHNLAATFLRQRAAGRNKWVVRLGGLSIALFAAGAVTAALVAAG